MTESRQADAGSKNSRSECVETQPVAVRSASPPEAGCYRHGQVFSKDALVLAARGRLKLIIPGIKTRRYRQGV